jgi:hypothetical protein
LDKSKALTANLDNLINYLNNKEIEDRLEAQRKAEIEAKQAEEALREAELARIAEEQEALFRAEELERQRREEERRKAEAEIARQAAAIEAARQAELAEKRRKEEEALRCEEEERIRLEAEQAEARRRAEEQARIQAELEEKRRRAEEQARIQAELEEKRRREEETRPQEEQPIVPISSVTSIVDAVADAQVTTVADSIETSESLADKLAKNADDTLASAINNKKIIDLKASITLGDRFRFQRELFGGNGEKMNKAISDFNSFETMTEAQEYIAKNFANWALDSDTVSDFIQLLQRRYL